MRTTPKGEACPACGWKFGPHICVDLSRPCPDEGKLTSRRGPMPLEQRQKIAEAQRRRHATFKMEGS